MTLSSFAMTFPWPLLFSMTLQAWKKVFLNSMTFHDFPSPGAPWSALILYRTLGLWLSGQNTLKKIRQYTELNCQQLKQELSYRKQIARQLHTHVEGIYRYKYYTSPLKSRLRVTQGHWKRNHWIDRTRLTISQVIWRWILPWPWNVG